MYPLQDSSPDVLILWVMENDLLVFSTEVDVTENDDDQTEVDVEFVKVRYFVSTFTYWTWVRFHFAQILQQKSSPRCRRSTFSNVFLVLFFSFLNRLNRNTRYYTKRCIVIQRSSSLFEIELMFFDRKFNKKLSIKHLNI